DNTPKSTSGATCKWPAAYETEAIDWPLFSPDLNPIEHLHWLLKQKTVALEYFVDCAQRAWREIPEEMINDLITSVPRQIQAIVRATGWQTKYWGIPYRQLKLDDSRLKE
ncbi:uncharacterized protein BDR25DRAFT_220729, partial [Lindgomyces ingoldianus]